MAAASSAPELFINVVDVFFGNGTNIGLGTVVGSAMFNILCVVAASALASGDHIFIDWRTLARDCMFYAVSLALLMLVMLGGTVSWLESFMMCGFYVIYILFMAHNTEILDRIFGPPAISDFEMAKMYEDFDNCFELSENDESHVFVEFTDEPLLTTGHTNSRRDEAGSFQSLSSALVLHPEINAAGYQKSARLRLRAVMLAVLACVRMYSKIQKADECILMINGPRSPIDKIESSTEREALLEIIVDGNMDEPRLSGKTSEAVDTGWKQRLVHICCMFPHTVTLLWRCTPLRFIIVRTIPDCTTERWRQWYMATFCISVTWMGILSYLMVRVTEGEFDFSVVYRDIVLICIITLSPLC
eukprot:52836_1